ncbi:unnamed protein product [Calypogeia fissa]
MGDMRVGAAHTTLVVPAKPVREHWLPLSNLDRVVMPSYIRVLFVYKTGKRCYGKLLEKLKCSLSRVLVDFYPMAGRLGVQEHGLVNLHCNGAGAIFTEASVEQSLEDVHVTRQMSALSGLQAAGIGVGPLYIPTRDSPVPALIIQATRFKCNSMVLAVNWHHTVADVHSGGHFLRSWAELAFGKTQPSLRPVHSRHLVKPRNELDVTFAEQWSNLARITRGPREMPPDPRTAVSAFNIGKKTVDSLKEEANKDFGGSEEIEQGMIFTAEESLLAHFWKLLAKARRVEEPQDEDNFSRLFMFVGGRKYLGLPQGYFGNVVGCACAMSTEESLQNSTLSSIAGLLRSSVEEVSCREFFQSLIDWVEFQRLSSTRHEQGLAVGHYVAATVWTFLPLYEIDFGWGKPTCALINPAPRRLFDSLVILPGPCPNSAQKALLQVRASCLNRLEADPEFTSLFTPTLASQSGNQS